MSLEQLPSNIEKGVERFAERHHLSHAEALVKLLEKGLQHDQSGGGIKGLSGEPMNDADARLMDEALDLAMEARRQRSERGQP